MIDPSLTRDFGRIWPQHVAALTQFLIDCRRHFDGDIDLFLVLCVIGDRTFSVRHAPPGMSFDEWSNASVAHVAREAINVQSVADFSGIPRETVRRKLSILVEKGWVQRDGDGLITATDKTKAELAPLTNATLVYLTRMKRTLAGS